MSDNTVVDAPWTIELRFGFSISQQYARAIRLAQKAAYSEYGDELRALMHSATFTAEELRAFQNLYGIVGKWKWKRTEIRICDEPVTPEQMEKPLHCYGKLGNTRAYLPTCAQEKDTPFGCSRLDDLFLLPEWKNAEMYRYPLYALHEQKAQIEIPRERYVDFLMSRCEIYRFCPIFPAQEIVKKIEALPEKVTLRGYAQDVPGRKRGIAFYPGSNLDFKDVRGRITDRIT